MMLAELEFSESIKVLLASSKLPTSHSNITLQNGVATRPQELHNCEMAPICDSKALFFKLA